MKYLGSIFLIDNVKLGLINKYKKHKGLIFSKSIIGLFWQCIFSKKRILKSIKPFPECIILFYAIYNPIFSKSIFSIENVK